MHKNTTRLSTCLFWISLLFLLNGHFQIAYSQVFASQAGHALPQQEPSARSEKPAQLLTEILKQIKTTHGVTFLYDPEVVGDKRATIKPERSKRVEKILEKMLSPYRLHFKKINETTYSIFPGKNAVSTADHTNQSAPYPAVVDTAENYTTRAVLAVTVTGKVTSDTGEGIPGVNVSLKKTTIGTSTGPDGTYSLSVQDDHANGTLVFSYIGYTTEEVIINGRSKIDVSLEPDIKSLQEVVVVGYGEQAKREVTGSIATVKAQEIEKSVVTSFQSAMQGRMPGVEIAESSGVPGAAVQVRVRGLGTINGGAGPLYVVDGVPILSGHRGDGDTPISTSDIGTSNNPLTDLNPNDIESIEVLKDAAAGAIYGARAAGGVVLITTKRGKAGKTSFNVRVYTGVSEIANQRSLLNGPQLLEIADEAWRNTFYSNPASVGLPLPATPMPAIPNFDRGRADTTNINHLDNVLRRGSTSEVSLSASNGTDKAAFYINGTYRKTQGTMRGNDFDYVGFRLNVDYNLTKALKFGANISPSYTYEKRLGSGSNITTGGFGGATTANLPIYPVYNQDGTYFNPWFNPVAFLDRDIYANNQKKIRILATLFFEATILPGLKFRSTANVETYNQTSDVYQSGLIRVRGNTDASPFADDQLARGVLQRYVGYNYLTENFFNYTKVLREHHSVSVVAGMRFQKLDTQYESMVGESFANSSLRYPSQAAFVEDRPQTQLRDNTALLGYFFRSNYTLKDRYLFGFTINSDGSSRFGKNKKFGTFPAVSAGWILSEENFLNKSRF